MLQPEKARAELYSLLHNQSRICLNLLSYQVAFLSTEEDDYSLPEGAYSSHNIFSLEAVYLWFFLVPSAPGIHTPWGPEPHVVAQKPGGSSWTVTQPSPAAPSSSR